MQHRIPIRISHRVPNAIPVRIPKLLLFLLTANLFFAPAVMAAADNAITRGQSYAITLLGLTVVALSIYLFTVMFQPEKF